MYRSQFKEMQWAEETPEQMYSNSILFQSGNYKILLGINQNGAFILQHLLNGIYSSDELSNACKTVNIRNAPSLQSTVIATGYANENYVYLNEEQLDDDGVTWLTIQLSDGRTGYVSKKIAVIQ